MSGEGSSRYGSLAATEAAQNLGGCATYTGFVSKYVLNVRFKLNNSGISWGLVIDRQIRGRDLVNDPG